MIKKADYFDWLCQQVNDEDFNASLYSSLLTYLFHTEFRWTVDLDSNRASDGVKLRTDYALEKDISPLDVDIAMNCQCTVLEMMVALALRCEHQIMEDLDLGPRVGRWFRAMLESLGLIFETDDYIDESFVYYIVESFLNREYEANGDGGLFKVAGINEDMRRIDIWYQMNLYLNSLDN